MPTSKSIAIIRTTIVVSTLSFAGLVAGFLLQVFLANRFGASSQTDAYLAAVTVPTVLNSVFLTSLDIVFIPVFLEFEAKADSAEAWRIASSFITLVALVLSIVSIPGIIWPEPWIRLIAPGLVRFPSTLHLASRLQQVVFPSIVLTALGGLLASLFYAKQSFALPASSTLIGNLVTLGSAWLLVDHIGIFSVAVGTLLGAAAQVVYLGLPLVERYPIRLHLDWTHPGIKQVGILILPWLLGATFYKASPVVERIVASQFPEGAISSLGYAYAIVSVLTFLLARGVSRAVFPTMSQLVAEGKHAELAEVIDSGLRLTIATATPALVLLGVANRDIVAVLYERGEFTREATGLAATAILAYLGAPAAMSLGTVIVYTYYALQDTITPAIVGVAGMVINIAAVIVLKDIVGYLAPAISFSLMATFNFAVMSIILKRRLHKLVGEGFTGYCFRTTIAGLTMLLVLLATNSMIAEASSLGGLYNFLRLACLAGVGLFSYLVVWSLLNYSLVRGLVGRIVPRQRELRTTPLPAGTWLVSSLLAVGSALGFSLFAYFLGYELTAALLLSAFVGPIVLLVIGQRPERGLFILLTMVSFGPEYSQTQWGVRSASDFSSIYNYRLIPGLIASPFDIAVVTIVAMWLINRWVVHKGRLRLPPRGLRIPLLLCLLFTIYATVIGLLGLQYDRELYYVLREFRPLAYGLLIFMVTVDVINSHTKAMTLWKLTMAITFVRGVQGIILHVLEVGRPYYGTQMIYYDYADSILLLGGLFSLLAWRLTERRRSPKVPLLLLVLPILYSFLFSFRRSFWLGAIFGGLTLMLYARPRGKAVIASLAMAVLAVSCLTLVLLLVVPKFQPLQVVAQRVTSIVDTQNDPSNFFRVLDTQNALHAIYASGTIGSGFGSRYAVVASAPGLSDFIFDASRASHNGYLYLAMKLGVLGAISWVVLAVSIGRLGVSLLKHKSPISRGIAMAVLATLVANAVAALFLPLFYNVRPMVMLSILAGLVTSAWMLDAGR